MFPIDDAELAFNAEIIRDKSYVGRTILVGRDEDSRLTLGCALSGRSDDSRNRFLRAHHHSGRVRTAVSDPSRPPNDPKLTIYDAMLQGGGKFIVSNGHQSNAIQSGLSRRRKLKERRSFCDTMQEWDYEPDPSHTPRIACIASLFEEEPFLQIAIVEKSPFDDTSVRRFWTYKDLPPGIGLFLSTYEDDGDPLPPWKGNPLFIKLGFGPQKILDQLKELLDGPNYVAAAVKTVRSKLSNSTIVVDNRYPPVDD